MGGLRWTVGDRRDIEDRRFDPPAVETIADAVDGDQRKDVMTTRAFSVTVRDRHTNAPVDGASVCVNDVCGTTEANGRVRLEGISSDWHQVQLAIGKEGYASHSESINLDPGPPPFGDVDWPDVYLEPQAAAGTGLRIEGDHFLQGDQRWLWKGSTEFRLPERVLAGVDITLILTDRRDAGANLVRMLAMKANNTGYELNPHAPGYWHAVTDTVGRIGQAGLYGEWTIFADTKRMMPDPVEQQAFYQQTIETMRQYPWMVVELVNEDKHATQAINAQAFRKPEGVLSSHGSGLSDAQPVKPVWDFATYHARRSGGLAKISSNYSAYVFQDTYPTPCPYVPEETIKPEQYGYDSGVARLMGQSACCAAGGTFHHSAWLEERPFNDGERACAAAFFAALRDEA